MRARVRTFNKLGRNTYLTTSSSVGEHLLASTIYYIFALPVCIIYKLAKFIIMKFKGEMKNDN